MSSILLGAVQDPQDDPEARRRRIRALSLAELLDITVYTPGKKDEPLSRVPAAVSVVQGEEIRRLGIRHFPDILRYVPGASVFQLDASTWAVSIRGFNTSQFSNKLQVLVDGRSVYTPIFSGVWWDIQDTLLEDVERIEVIRGPGASIWGANAVNGVVNIITKKAADTTGGYLAAGAGNEMRGFGEGRWGAAIADGVHLRVFAKGESWDEQFEAQDDGEAGRAGFRLDAGDAFTLIGEFYRLQTRHEQNLFTLAAPGVLQTFTDEYDAVGGFLTAKASTFLGGAGRLSAQGSLEISDRHRAVLPEEHLVVGELSLVHELPDALGFQLLWGVSARSSWDHVQNSFTVSYTPKEEHRDMVGLFVEAHVDLLPSLLTLLAGTRVEYNDHTGLELQPTLRLSFTPADDLTFWAAASRALRTPSRTDDDIRINFLTTPGPNVLAVQGDRDVRSEELIAFEAGVRARLAAPLTADLAAFYNRYDDVIAQGPGSFSVEAVPPPAHGLLLSRYENAIDGRTCGAELTATWRALDGWTLTGTYALLRVLMNEIDDALASTMDESLEGEPRHRVTLRSSMNLPADLYFDAGLRFTDMTRNPELSSWTEIDVRLAWRPLPALEVGVAGRNLMHDRHRERGADPPTGLGVTEQERAAYVFADWRF